MCVCVTYFRIHILVIMHARKTGRTEKKKRCEQNGLTIRTVMTLVVFLSSSSVHRESASPCNSCHARADMYDKTYYSAINCSGMCVKVSPGLFCKCVCCFLACMAANVHEWKRQFRSGRLLTCGQRYRQSKAAGIWCLGDPRIAV